MTVPRDSAEQLALQGKNAFTHYLIARVDARDGFRFVTVRGARLESDDAHGIFATLHEHRGLTVDQGDRGRWQDGGLLFAQVRGVNARVHRLAGAQPAIVIVDFDADRRAARFLVDHRAHVGDSTFEDLALCRERAQLDLV